MAITDTVIPSQIDTSSVDDEYITLNSDAKLTAGDAYFNDMAVHEIELIELQAEAGVTPYDHTALISDTFSSSSGYNGSVYSGSTSATYNTTSKVYDFRAGLGEVGDIIFSDDFNRANSATIGNSWTETETGGTWAISNNQAVKTCTSAGFGHIAHNIAPTGTTVYYDVELTLTWSSIREGDGYIDILDSSNTAVDTIKIHHTAGNANDLMLNYGGVSEAVTGFGTSPVRVRIQAKLNESTEKIEWYKISINGAEATTHDNSGSGYNFLNSTTIDKIRLGSYGNSSTTASFDFVSVGQSYNVSATQKVIAIDVPSNSGTINATQLVVNQTLDETDASITYSISDGTNTDTNLAVNTKNNYVNLTGNPTKLYINLVNENGTPTTGYPAVKSYALKVWTS